MMFFHLAFITLLTAVAPGVPCQSTMAPALDHAIVVVHDLERASSAFRSVGFRIKPGRLHPNGLLNRHIKFPDGSAIELMTLHNPAGDAMARDYENLLRVGEGGVYVALKVREIGSVEQVASSLQLDARQSSSGPWQFLSFSDQSPAAAVFFTAGGTPLNDPDSVFRHEPRVTALTEVWLEGGFELSELLLQLGARDCGTEEAPDGRIGQRWGLSRGSLVLVPPRSGERPRLLGIVLETPDGRDDRIQLHEQFWIQYRKPP